MLFPVERALRSFVLTAALIAATLPLASSLMASMQDSAATPESATANPAENTATIDFARDVFPIFQSYCLKCHGPDEQEGDLRFDQADILLTDDFVVPGDSEDSRVYETMISDEDDRMPPEDEGLVVPDNDIATVKAWIDAGAKWSDISHLMAGQDPQTTEGESPANQTGDVSKAAPNSSKPATAPKQLSPRAEAWITVWRAFGDLHPAAAHFPVALLIVGGLFAIFGMFGSYRSSDFAFCCLWLGALSALVASGLGWSYAWNEGHREDPFKFETDARLFWHRWTGVILSLLAFLVAVWATIARRRDPENGHGWKFALLLLAGLTMYVGHAGGDLSHPRGYKRLYELFGWEAAKVQPAAKTDAAENAPAQE